MGKIWKYRYTTGPISVSENANNIRVLILNNSAKKHEARVKIFNLDPAPKSEVFDETSTLASHSTYSTEYIPMFNTFEVQVYTDSFKVYIWVGGRAGIENLTGNTVLHEQLVRF
ncbi:MAG: hypothetical protein PHC92_08045 [Syntrophomonadaceae bacterium]|nr:hypothetical protein [Syntrophomonadaceae bacterium]MDD3022869.1 hypothetical protein [Syntrophomonadaceae bacterium]